MSLVVSCCKIALALKVIHMSEICRDTHLDCQRQHNSMVHSIRKIIRWLSFGSEPNLFQRYHPLRPFVHWYHSKILNEYLSKEVDKRYDLYRNQETENATDLKQTKTIIDLALSTFKSQSDSVSTPSSSMDPFFKRICMSQIKLFLFSGHDTTSSAICFHLYLTSKFPSTLDRLRAEHDSVFSTDTFQTASLISSNPHLLNQLPFTTAVIKESLRLFPTVTISREGERDFHVTDQVGHRFPTEGFLVFPNIHTPQHDPAFWPRADAFLPERWLVGPNDPLYPVKGAWRAFEHGPRACIGQELAMLEMKTVLVMVARMFDFRPAYEELDKQRGRAVKTVHGERAYQVQMMQPQGDLPCRVEYVIA
jgi:sterigmatocystin biosynthesis cytochrome P450 monooxygenase